MRPIRSIATLLLVAGVAVAGCGTSQPERNAAPSSAPPAATAPPATKSPAVTAPGATQAPTTAGGTRTEAAVLADGRHPVYLRTVDADAGTITVDVIQFYFGDDATREAARDHQESPPPNDYYIRNVNPRLRTLPVRSDVTVTVNTLAAAWTGSATKDVRVTFDRLADLTLASRPPFWITVQHGQVVKIAEQYIP